MMCFQKMEICAREMEIPCHEHTLRLVDDVEKRGDDDDDDDAVCDGCNQYITGGSAYDCTLFDFFLDKWCAGLPRVAATHPPPTTPTHPCRPETFRWKPVKEQSYSCSDCGFDLDVNCAAFPSTRFSDQIQHPSHQHPFLVYYMNPYYSMQNYTTIHFSRCGLLLEENTVYYVCTECILLLHPSCVELGL